MKSIAILSVAVLILLPSCSRERMDPAIASYVDSLMNARFKSGQPGAVILIARDGAPVFRKAYGFANLELSVPARPENVFAIASMTKQFTAVCVLQLVQQGKLSLGDDIRRYLPEYNTHGRLITIEHLLTHTNGIPNITYRPEFYRKGFEEPTREELLQCVAQDSLLFEPGTDWSYNDFGYTLAAFIVERVSGMPFHEYMQKHIFDALGMTNTYFGTKERVIPLLVNAYIAADGPAFRPEENSDWSWNIGMGDILTTVDDMLRWDEALYTDRLVSRDLIEKAFTSYVLTDGRKANYGYGWWIGQAQGVQIMVHGGALGGFRSFDVRIPAQHIFVVLLSNDGEVNTGALLRAIVPRVAALNIPVPAARTLSREELKPYVGVYDMLHFGLLNTRDITQGKLYRTISLKDSVLLSQPAGGEKTQLLNVGNDLFVARGTNTYFQFRRDNAGKVTLLEFYSEPIIYGPVHIEPKTQRPLPEEKVPVALDEIALKAFAGKYNFGGEHTARVRIEGSRIFMEGVGELSAETQTRFFVKNLDVTVEFRKNLKGDVTGLVLDRVWREEARKVQ